MNTLKFTQRIRTIFVLSILSLLIPVVTMAQFPTAASYPFTASQKTFNYLSGGTPVSFSSSNWDDWYVSNIPIGFTFTFAGTAYTTVTAVTNGVMSFGNNTTGYSWYYGAPQSYLQNNGPCVMACWHDGSGDATGSGAASPVSYLTTGTAPNRVFTLEFKNWGSYPWSSYPGWITYQYILYEGGPIEIMYQQESGSTTFGSTGSGGAIGIAKDQSDWQTLNNTSANPTSSSTLYTASVSGKPASGQSYLWGQVPCTGTPTTSISGPDSVCPNKPFGLGLAGLSIYSGFSFQWQTSTNGTSWANWTGTVSTSGNITDVISAPKWYRVTVTCLASGQSYTTAPKQVNIAPFYYCYCEGSKATSGAGLDIGNVSVLTAPANQVLLNNGNANPFLNNANATQAYTDFRKTLPAVPMYHDSSYYLQATQTSSIASFAAGTAAIFIDYNRNGKFDPWERVLDAVTNQALPN
ncbi:MAG: hypothetical protein K0R82_2117, partial [Flavipsychrobacter sp.]|nr:hypothetical protein [Flavipsychrobacter sp.]